MIGDALAWADANPRELSYNVSSKKDMLQVTPNVVAFQAVMHGIADRLKATETRASRIVVDQQSQFNKAQRTLAEFYRDARGFKASLGPGLPLVDHTHAPEVPIEFSTSTDKLQTRTRRFAFVGIQTGDGRRQTSTGIERPRICTYAPN